MPGFSCSTVGSLEKIQEAINAFTTRLAPAFEAQVEKDGELIVKTLVGHIENQDLSWTPLSDVTVMLKGGDTTIYVETGFLKSNLITRKVKTSGGFTFYIGAPKDVVHAPSGVPLDKIMLWLEYGTDKIPARPLFRPTEEEIKPILREHWSALLKELLSQSG